MRGKASGMEKWSNVYTLPFWAVARGNGGILGPEFFWWDVVSLRLVSLWDSKDVGVDILKELRFLHMCDIFMDCFCFQGERQQQRVT